MKNFFLTTFLTLLFAPPIFSQDDLISDNVPDQMKTIDKKIRKINTEVVTYKKVEKINDGTNTISFYRLV